jgi:hypothetical protein
MWRSEGEWIINGLNQSQQWWEQTFTLREQEATKLTRIAVIIWTKDTIIHTVDIDYILFGKIVTEAP